MPKKAAPRDQLVYALKQKVADLEVRLHRVEHSTMVEEFEKMQEIFGDLLHDAREVKREMDRELSALRTERQALKFALSGTKKPVKDGHGGILHRRRDG